MKVRFAHFNYHVTDMERSVKFYTEALGLKVIREMGSKEGPVWFVMLGDSCTDVELELKWAKEHPQSYDPGECSYHFCVYAEDYDAMLAMHEKMNCIHEVIGNGRCYFIKDPDGYLVEVMRPPVKKPDYLYNSEECPCPRGAEANCPRYRKCDLCIANHHSSERSPLTACEKKALAECGEGIRKVFR